MALSPKDYEEIYTNLNKLDQMLQNLEDEIQEDNKKGINPHYDNEFDQYVIDESVDIPLNADVHCNIHTELPNLSVSLVNEVSLFKCSFFSCIHILNF